MVQMSEKNMKTFSIVVFTDFLFYVYHFRQNPPPLCFSMKPNRCVCVHCNCFVSRRLLHFLDTPFVFVCCLFCN